MFNKKEWLKNNPNYNKEYYQKHRDKLLQQAKERYNHNKKNILQQQKERYHKNRDSILQKEKECNKIPEVKAKKKEYKKEYYKKNRDEILQTDKEHYQKNKEKILQRDKEYRQNNPDKKKESDKKWREKNPTYDKERNQRPGVKAKKRETSKEWFKNNPDKKKESNKKSYQKHKEKRKETTREWFKNNPEKTKGYKLKNNKKENQKRIELSKATGIRIPLIGEKDWLSSETKLYAMIKYLANGYTIKRHEKFKWLGMQHIDIYFPEIRTGIEYDGMQHKEFYSLLHRKNLNKFLYQLELDQRKDKLCKENNLQLIRWNYKTPITEQNVIKLLTNLQIPINQNQF